MFLNLIRCHRPWICRGKLWIWNYLSGHSHLCIYLLDGLQHSDRERKYKELRDLPKRAELITGPRVAPCLWTVYPGLSLSHHSVLCSLLRRPFHTLVKHYVLSPCYSSFCSFVHSISRDHMPLLGPVSTYKILDIVIEAGTYLPVFILPFFFVIKH